MYRYVLPNSYHQWIYTWGGKVHTNLFTILGSQSTTKFENYYCVSFGPIFKLLRSFLSVLSSPKILTNPPSLVSSANIISSFASCRSFLKIQNRIGLRSELRGRLFLIQASKTTNNHLEAQIHRSQHCLVCLYPSCPLLV